MTVHLFTLGGTISMAGRTDRGDIRLGGEQLLQDVGESLRGIEVAVRDVRAVPSAHLSFSDILEIADRAGEAVEQGASGIVLVQGTDTIEESAFLLDCVWPHDAPLVVSGAMRNPRLPGADGPANLVAAIRVAASAAARERGVLVVLNDEIHAARLVRKAHSMSTAAFTSPDLGPVGHLVEGTVHLLAGVPRTEPVPGVTGDRVAATKVALHTVTMEDDGTSLSGLRDTHHGLVVAAFGVGHVPAAMAPVLGDLAAHLPVVLTSRTGAGPVLADTYGAPGSERDLRERGLVNGGFLHPLKARVLLRLLLATGHDTAAIASRFAALG